MLWLYSSAGVTLSAIAEYESIVTTERYREHSEWSGRFPATSYTALAAAYFAIVSDEPEVYLVEHVEIVTEGVTGYCIASGRSASALPHLRTLIAVKDWLSRTAGYMVSDLLDDLTDARAIPLAFGTGLTVGSSFSLQRVWGDMGDIILEILGGQATPLGQRTRLDGATVKLDVYEPNVLGTAIGEKYGSGSASKYVTDKQSWRNYAYVLGEGEGAARTQRIVDQTSGAERRELYVDARDLSATCTAAIAVTGSLDTDRLTATTHGLVDGNAVQFSSLSGCAPLANSTTYWVRDAGTNTFRVAATAPGAAIDITSDGTGTVSQVVLTDTQYDALLDARGAAKLADTRKIEYADAEVTTALRAGDVIEYDSGDLWTATLMVTEAVTTREGGTVKHTATLGEPPATFKKTIRRYF